MALRTTAWRAMILAFVILTLTFFPSWSVAFLILFGVIGLKFQNGKRGEAAHQDSPLEHVHVVDIPSDDASALLRDALRHASDYVVDDPPPMMGDAPDQVDALASAADASTSSVNAPADASYDVSALAPAVDAAGKTRRKPELSSISLSSRNNYEVFLSYEDHDTCKGLIDHLYNGLVNAGFVVFKSDKNRCAGEEIKMELKEVIRRSTVSIAIFSENYASSVSCLSELEQMLENNYHGQTIIPIFCDVSPADVKYQTGYFGRSFNLHMIDRVDSETIKRWRDALQHAAQIKGYDREKKNEGQDDQLARVVVKRVARLVGKDDRVGGLVGIDLHVKEMMRKLNVAYSKGEAIKLLGEEVRIVGICGVQGVGKTTLARVVFSKMRNLFDACSFVENTRSEGIQFLRQKLIADLQKQNPAPLGSSGEGVEDIAGLCRKTKVLLVLDDIDEVEQLILLANSLFGFGPGSRIIVTTRKIKFFSAFDIKAIDRGTVKEHEVRPTSYGHARKHAFEGSAPKDVSEYLLSEDIVRPHIRMGEQISYLEGPEFNEEEDNKITTPAEDSPIN